MENEFSKAVTMFAANDGTLFASESGAQAHSKKNLVTQELLRLLNADDRFSLEKADEVVDFIMEKSDFCYKILHRICGIDAEIPIESAQKGSYTDKRYILSSNRAVKTIEYGCHFFVVGEEHSVHGPYRCEDKRFSAAFNPNDKG